MLLLVGKQGETDMKWLEDNLMTPYAKGVAAIDGIRQQIKRDFRTAVKAFPRQYRLLNKEINKSGFTTTKHYALIYGRKQVLKFLVYHKKMRRSLTMPLRHSLS